MACRATCFVLLSLLAGCGWHDLTALHGHVPTVAPIENPMLIPVSDREFVWNQIVDTVDDYFHIQREQRVQLVGNVLTEGRVETVPATASTLLEPWRRDSTPGYERLHSTLQSIRRYAQVRVLPTDGGYLVEVLVFKELEDLSQPEHATAGAATLRHDSSLTRRDQQIDPVNAQPLTMGWIPLGRDVSLEQQMLAELRARLTGF